MTIKHLLPCSCGQKIPVEKRQAGQTVRCVCGASLNIPGLQAISRLELAETEAVRHAPHWGTRQRLLLLGWVLTAVAFGFIYFYVQKRPTRFNVTEYSAIQACELWASLKAGVDQPPMRHDLLYLRDVYLYKLSLAASMVLLGVGLLVLGSAFFFPKRPPVQEKEG